MTNTMHSKDRSHHATKLPLLPMEGSWVSSSIISAGPLPSLLLSSTEGPPSLLDSRVTNSRKTQGLTLTMILTKTTILL